LVQLAVVDKHSNHIGLRPLASDLPQRLVGDVRVDTRGRQQAAGGARIINTSGTIGDLHNDTFMLRYAGSRGS
jgi:hypothetical protein